MNQEEIRKQFERLVIELNSGVLLERNANDSYKASLPQYMWWSYQAALASKQEDIKQGLDDIQLSMSMFANKEDYLKAVKEQEHIESNQESYSDLLQQSKDKFELKFCGNSIEADWIYSDLLEKFSLLNQPTAIDPEQEPTIPENTQDWKGMDGAIAWHLIHRHADNWADIGKMMDEWLAANIVSNSCNQRATLKALVLFQAECEILSDTFRHGNMASDAIGKIDVTKYLTKDPKSAQDNEGWITFNDGGRPVLHHCFVDVKLSDGSFIYKTMAGVFGWRWVDGCVNIIEYRIAKESQ